MQTARWVARPIRFLEDCRRRYGDVFSVTFQGFRSPLVMVSRPDVIRALYSERRHGLPPGRTLTIFNAADRRVDYTAGAGATPAANQAPAFDNTPLTQATACQP